MGGLEMFARDDTQAIGAIQWNAGSADELKVRQVKLGLARVDVRRNRSEQSSE